MKKGRRVSRGTYVMVWRERRRMEAVARVLESILTDNRLDFGFG